MSMTVIVVMVWVLGCPIVAGALFPLAAKRAPETPSDGILWISFIWPVALVGALLFAIGYTISSKLSGDSKTTS